MCVCVRPTSVRLFALQRGRVDLLLGFEERVELGQPPGAVPDHDLLPLRAPATCGKHRMESFLRSSSRVNMESAFENAGHNTLRL